MLVKFEMLKCPFAELYSAAGCAQSVPLGLSLGAVLQVELTINHDPIATAPFQARCGT